MFLHAIGGTMQCPKCKNPQMVEEDVSDETMFKGRTERKKYKAYFCPKCGYDTDDEKNKRS